MDYRDGMKVYGEWLCSIAPNPMIKSLMHNSISTMYERDYVIVTDLCNGFGNLPEISMSTIDGAKERYKQVNKSVLEMAPFPEGRKKDVSAQIDANAESLKQKWISTIQQRGIKITNK